MIAQDEASGTLISGNIFQSNPLHRGSLLASDARYTGTLSVEGAGTIVERNQFIRNGNDPRTLTGQLWLLPPSYLEAYEVVADDGLTVFGVGEPNTADGMTIIGNTGIRNADLGFDAPGVIDGGANLARQNGNPLECMGVACLYRY